MHLITVDLPIVPDSGEDAFEIHHDRHGLLMCVADGCGGLGSQRYPSLNDHTGAYAASRLAVRSILQWRSEHAHEAMDLPEIRQSLENHLEHMFQRFAQKHPPQQKMRIVGSMQRSFPTALCAVQLLQDNAYFVWAGDCRGYVLDMEGLHQCTKDDLKTSPDALESLYRDTPLSNYLCADNPIHLNMSSHKLTKPCFLIAATDGAYNSLPSPMEFEMLLLDSLVASSSWQTWQNKFQGAVKRIAQDDATLLIASVGMEDFSVCKGCFSKRRTELQKQFITPIRRHKQELAYIREKWLLYRKSYEWLEDSNT